MNLAVTLVENILPLYGLVGLGYIAGRWLDVSIHSVARIVIYILLPMVMLGAMAHLKLSVEYVVLPLVILGISLGVTGIVFNLAKWRWKSNAANLIGLGCVGGNTGYFGLPIALALYGQDAAGPFLLMNVATAITEVTLGYYLAARGHHTVKESLRRVVRLPSLHALWIGLLLNVLRVPLPDIYYKYWTYATGAWVYLGMMIIGLALSKLPRLTFDLRLIGWTFAAKSFLWPGLATLFIAADLGWLHLLNGREHGLILVFCSVPLSANFVAYAAQLNLHTEKAASSVLLSTLFSVVYLPVLFVVEHHFGFIG